MEAEKKISHGIKRTFFIDHQRGIGRFFMWKLSKNSQTEGVVMYENLTALSFFR